MFAKIERASAIAIRMLYIGAPLPTVSERFQTTWKRTTYATNRFVMHFRDIVDSAALRHKKTGVAAIHSEADGDDAAWLKQLIMEPFTFSGRYNKNWCVWALQRGCLGP